MTDKLNAEQVEQIFAKNAIAWIATGPDGKVFHFSKHDGWKVEVVQTEQNAATQSDLKRSEATGLSSQRQEFSSHRPDETPALAAPDYSDLCRRLEGAYSTVFERNLAREAAAAIRELEGRE